MFLCSSLALFSCSSVPLFHCSTIPVFYYSNIPLFQYFTIPIFHYSNILLFQSSTVPTEFVLLLIPYSSGLKKSSESPQALKKWPLTFQHKTCTADDMTGMCQLTSCFIKEVRNRTLISHFKRKYGFVTHISAAYAFQRRMARSCRQLHPALRDITFDTRWWCQYISCNWASYQIQQSLFLILNKRGKVESWSVQQRHKERMSFIVHAALFLSLVALSQACTCRPQHPQEAFCNAGFGKLRIIH